MKKFLLTSMILTLLLIMCMPTVFAYKGNLNIKISSDGIVTWDKVTGAKDYNLLVEYGRLEGSTEFYDPDYTSESFNIKEVFDNAKKETGVYYVSVYAVGDNGTFFDYCEYNYTSNFSYLDTPTNLRWDGKIARWDPVENATKYTVLLRNEKGNGVTTVHPSNPEYDFSSKVKDQFYFTVEAGADNYKYSSVATSPRYKAPTTTSVSEVQFEDFTWLTNGQEYTQSNPKVVLKSDFPGTITKQQIKINGKVMEADTTAGDKIELAVYIKLNDGYAWDSSIKALLNNKNTDTVIKTDDMADNERAFVWSHTTGFTDKIKITDQSPETLEYTNGEDVKLFVKATGANNYQWSIYEERAAGRKMARGFYRIEGATSNEYVIKNADSSLDGKKYRCTLAVDDETIYTKIITLKLVEKETEEPVKTEEPTKTEEPAKTEEPTKTEEPVKTDEPTEEKTWTKASDWAEEELYKANKLDVIPEIFKKQDLTQNITRKEFAHVAVKLYEKLTGNKAIAVSNNPFKDTDDVEVLKAYNLGITKGTSEVTFEPDELITREQMATMMTRALTNAGIDTKVDLEKATKFADDAEMHDWGKESIYYMSSIEIIKGVGNNTFDVLGNATREQALLISERSAEKFAK